METGLGHGGYGGPPGPPGPLGPPSAALEELVSTSAALRALDYENCAQENLSKASDALLQMAQCAQLVHDFHPDELEAGLENRILAKGAKEREKF